MPNIWDEIFAQFAPQSRPGAKPMPQEPDIFINHWQVPESVLEHGQYKIQRLPNGQWVGLSPKPNEKPFKFPADVQRELEQRFRNGELTRDIPKGMAVDKNIRITPENGDYVGPSGTKHGYWRIHDGETIFVDGDGKIHPSAIPYDRLVERIHDGDLKLLKSQERLDTEASSAFSRSQDIRQQTQRYTNLARGLQEATKGVDPKSPMFRKLLDQVLKNQGFGDPSLIMNLIPRSLIQQVQEQVQKLTQPPQG